MARIVAVPRKLWFNQPMVEIISRNFRDLEPRRFDAIDWLVAGLCGTTIIGVLSILTFVITLIVEIF